MPLAGRTVRENSMAPRTTASMTRARWVETANPAKAL